MNNLDKAFEHINNNKFEVENISFKGKTIRLHINTKHAFEAVNIAATPDWKYTDQNCVPDSERKVLCYDSKNNPKVGYHKLEDNYNTFVDNNNRFFYCIAWCELPIFNNNK